MGWPAGGRLDLMTLLKVEESVTGQFLATWCVSRKWDRVVT